MYYSQEKADRIVNFVIQLKHTKGTWRGVNFTLLPWQEKGLRELFGTVRDDGFRQYNTAYWEVSKKQGKSELAAAVALYCLVADDEWAAEVYGCAADRQNASIIYDVAVDMVEQNPTLKRKIKLVLSQKRMVYMPTRSYYQVLSAEAYSKHGYNVHAVVFDEIHSQPDRRLFDVMTGYSGDARNQPLYFLISTAGDDAQRTSIGWELHQSAENILLGTKQDPTFHAMIFGICRENNRIWQGSEYELVKGGIDWEDEKVWRKVNPSIDHTVPLKKIQDAYVRAKGNPAMEKNFRWLRLNSWEKVNTSKWLGLDFWDLCRGNIDINNLRHRPCYGGLDLSSKIDMTAFVLLFPPDDINNKWVVLPFFWVPEDRLTERVRTDKVPYDTWHEQGFLKTTPGNVIDYAFIEKEIVSLAGKFRIEEIGYDSWNATQTAIRLQDEGLVMVETRQGYKTMSPAMKEIEQLTIGKKIQHDGNPVLRWNVNNVQVKINENDDIRPVKDAKYEKIDGLVATINAMARAMRHEDNISVYAHRGVITI